MDRQSVQILATADLHYNIARSRIPTEELARRICRTPADVLVLVGDSAGTDTRILYDCLSLFHDFPGLRLLVPGNHCLWCQVGEDSLTRYYHTLPEVAARAGFTVLDHAPQIVGSVGLVGSVGWYDFSFRDDSLGVPVPFYQAKVAPGAANYYSEYRHLIEAHSPHLTDRHYRISARWMDGVHVRLGISDEQFTDRLAGRLADQLAEMAPKVERIVAFIHHLPFEQLVPRSREDKWTFAAAFLGSGRFGEVLLAQPKVTDVLCGHSHWPQEQQIGTIRVINIGSTYTDKQMVELAL